jgi:hypothetical protein
MNDKKRIQRRRVKGWKMPEGAIYVGRPTKWGNPFRVTKKVNARKAISLYRLLVQNKISEATLNKALKSVGGKILDGQALGVFQLQIIGAIMHKALPELRGKDLACWCKEGEPCHADVLLELANPPEPK